MQDFDIYAIFCYDESEGKRIFDNQEMRKMKPHAPQFCPKRMCVQKNRGMWNEWHLTLYGAEVYTVPLCVPLWNAL